MIKSTLLIITFVIEDDNFGNQMPFQLPIPKKIQNNAPDGRNSYYLDNQVSITIQLLGYVNRERVNRGLSPLCASRFDRNHILTLFSKLIMSSAKHSLDMAKSKSMSHQLPGEPSLGARVSDTGLSWMSIAENIAVDQQSIENVMQAWMNSPGKNHIGLLLLEHRKNILGSYQYFGAARISEYWTQDFATTMSNQAEITDCI